MYLIVMLEASAENMSQPDFQGALAVGVKHSQDVVQQIKHLCSKCGKEKRPLPELPQLQDEIVQAMQR